MLRIKKTREALGVTQKQVGQALGMAKETYRNIENGRIRLKLDDYLSICRFLGVPATYFLSDEQDKYVVVDKQELINVFALIKKIKLLEEQIKFMSFPEEDEQTLYMADSAKHDD